MKAKQAWDIFLFQCYESWLELFRSRLPAERARKHALHNTSQGSYWLLTILPEATASKKQNRNDFQDEGIESNHLWSYISETQLFDYQSIKGPL